MAFNLRMPWELLIIFYSLHGKREGVAQSGSAGGGGDPADGGTGVSPINSNGGSAWKSNLTGKLVTD